MREKIFRMERVTYAEQGVEKLEKFNLQIYTGEVMGLIPVNAHGMAAFLKLLQFNLPLYDGYIYYGGELVNSWRESSRKENRISIIQAQNRLVSGMTVADNIFVLRTGFRQHVVQTLVLKKQLEPFMQDIGMNISADTRVENLSAFERVVVELLRAVVMGYRLIVLDEISAFISEKELEKLYGIIRHYTERRFSFLYISPHFEEILHICNRTAFLSNGRVQKIVQEADMNRKMLQECLEGYDRSIWVYPENRHLREAGKEISLEIEYAGDGDLKKVSFAVREGECVTVQAQDNQVLQSCVSYLTGEKSRIKIDGKSIKVSGHKDIAVVSAELTTTMIFPEMSYMDNLCMGLAQRLPDVWRGRKIRNSIKREYAPVLGEEIFRLPMEKLTERQKYQLVYTRIELQRPRVAFLIQPFMGADMPHRRFIWEMLEQLLEKGIALVLLSVNPLDSWLVAQRTLQLGSGGIMEEKKQFENHKQNYSFMIRNMESGEIRAEPHKQRGGI